MNHEYSIKFESKFQVPLISMVSFVLGIRHLPSDLQRNFGLMSDLDKKAESKSQLYNNNNKQ